MDANQADRLNLRVLLLVAALGAVLMVLGWYRFFSAS
jgi:hypothetical protein